MKVTLINTMDLQGGAAIACHRLTKAFQQQESIDAKMLVKDKTGKEDFVLAANNSALDQYKGKFNFALEKATFLAHEQSKAIRFAFSNPNFGQDISNLPVIKNADIIHLHWINKGFLSFAALDKLFKLNKPVVWTLHDMWPFTGGCHYAGSCTNFQKQCGQCAFVKRPSDTDLSRTIWNKKKNIFANANLNVVTCSKWLMEVAQSSSLLENKKVLSIPNAIDTTIFKPAKAKPKKEKFTILFQAMNINDTRKGLKYFLEALALLEKKHPAFIEKIQLLIFGSDSSGSLQDVKVEVKYLGLLSKQKDIIDAYHQSDVFVIPSLEDNLPNTIMEAMACGVPVVGFETGGIPEMVDHKENGYIAPQRNAAELATGIKWVLKEEERLEKLAAQAVVKVQRCYAEEIVVAQYYKLYQSLLPAARQA